VGLHGNGVAGMFGDVPAGAIAAVREERAAAGKILLGAKRVDLVFDLVAFGGYGEQAHTMDRTRGRSKPGKGNAEEVPGSVAEVEGKEERERQKENSPGRKKGMEL
jgi:hypothetical protein